MTTPGINNFASNRVPDLFESQPLAESKTQDNFLQHLPLPQESGALNSRIAPQTEEDYPLSNLIANNLKQRRHFMGTMGTIRAGDLSRAQLEALKGTPPDEKGTPDDEWDT